MLIFVPLFALMDKLKRDLLIVLVYILIRFTVCLINMTLL